LIEVDGELTSKAFVFALIEEVRHYLFHKGLAVVDFEGGATLRPRHNMRIVFSLGIFQPEVHSKGKTELIDWS